MLFLLEYSYSTENRPKVIERFLATGGGKLDKKGKLIGRWHEIGGNGGVAIIETSDSASMARVANDWADVMEMRFAPVMDDAMAFKLNKA